MFGKPWPRQSGSRARIYSQCAICQWVLGSQEEGAGLCCFIEGDPRKTSEDFSRDPHPGLERWRSWVGPEKPHPLPKPEL